MRLKIKIRIRFGVRIRVGTPFERLYLNGKGFLTIKI